ncbi:MAG: hypothetical protein ACFE8O_03870 [Candidatus Hermodarchaeota archaeon]
MAKGSPCHRCGKTRRILLQTDYVNTKIERPLFPKDKLICKQCVQKALGERRYFRLAEDFIGIAYK